MTTSFASSPSPSRRTIVPVPYLGCSTTVPVRAGLFGTGGALGNSFLDWTGGISCGGLREAGVWEAARKASPEARRPHRNGTGFRRYWIFRRCAEPVPHPTAYAPPVLQQRALLVLAQPVAPGRLSGIRAAGWRNPPLFEKLLHILHRVISLARIQILARTVPHAPPLRREIHLRNVLVVLNSHGHYQVRRQLTQEARLNTPLLLTPAKPPTILLPRTSPAASPLRVMPT